MNLYFDSTLGCGIRKAKNFKSGESAIKREVGTAQLKYVRVATEKDIEWVKAMQGRTE